MAAAAALAADPDLVISSIALSTNRAYPGEKVRIDSVTRNNGGATGWWKYCDVHYYFGTSASLANATKIGSGVTPNYQEVNGIDNGEEEEDTLNWTIPADTPPGSYYIICKADGGNAIKESNENNNTRAVKFTVVGTPSFSGLKWSEPLYVSHGDSVTMYGECANIPAGRSVTLTVCEDDPLGDDTVTNFTATVRESADGTCYFTRTWTAVWEDDAKADPEYYFKATYKQDGKEYSAASGKSDGECLHVSKDRMVPCYSPLKNDFYYDNNITTNRTDGGPVGASSGSVALTDDRIPIILVHGMSGDGKPETLNYWYGWMNADSNYKLGYFNQSPMSNMFRVYRYVYDSRDFIATNGLRFAKFVNDFYDTHPEFANRQVVIMAHSMGGLVSRYAMNSNPDFAAKVHRLVTLGSPHLGAQGANPTWIKYSGPDDNSWIVSGIYNSFNLHNNTAGCFELAWYATNEIPGEALTEAAIAEMGDSYNTALLRTSLRDPFTGRAGMRSKSADNKCVLFAGSSTNLISDSMKDNWPDASSGEIKTDHMGLWAAAKIYRSMSYADGTGVGDNDGLVPVISALMNDSLGCALSTDKNAHPTAAKFNLNVLEGQQVDHASYLDVPVTMDSVKAVLLTQVRGYCAPAAAVEAGAAWQLVDNVTQERSPWQKSSVRLPALIPGRSYTVEFKGDISGWTKPGNVTFTATKSVTKAVTGTYVAQSGGGSATNHAPADLALDNASVEENAPAGTLVGTLSAYDADGDPLTYSLVAGEGATGNDCFTISGNKLLTAQVFDFEEHPKHYCRIRASDGKGGTAEEAFVIDVVNLAETTPAQATGDAWLNLKWDACPGATDYRVDVSAGILTNKYIVPKGAIGTNEFLEGQYWRYDAPGGATTATVGAIKTAPTWQVYTETNKAGVVTNEVDGHFLCGSNNVALLTEELPIKGAGDVGFYFNHGTWNGKNDTNVSRLDASYRFDDGPWMELGTSIATGTADGGDVAFEKSVEVPEGASTVSFKMVATNAYLGDNRQRGTYVTEAVVSLRGQGDFESASVHLAGYPYELNTTGLQVTNLPADTRYWYHVEALVDGEWVDAAWGSQLTENTVPPPTDLAVAPGSSTSLGISWNDPGLVDHFEVQLTPILASGLQSEIAAAPNADLAAADNASGWRYSADHAATAKSWFCKSGETPYGDYHGLLIAPTPGVQSPELDLSGCESASFRFVARTRGVSNNVTGEEMVLYYKVPDGDWTPAGSATTNQVAIYNNRFLYLDVPEEALVKGVRFEIGVPGATGRGGVWDAGKGDGIRNVTLLGVGKPAPDYGAESAVTNLPAVPAPLADAAEASPAASTLAKGLAMETAYWVRVRSVDASGNVSAWVEASGETLAADEPHALALSGNTVRENNAAGEYIGTLSAEDADEGDEITWELAEGEGSDANGLVEIVGAAVKAKGTFTVPEGEEAPSIRVRATDAQGLWSEETFALNVVSAASEEVPEETDRVTIPAEIFSAMAQASGARITDFRTASAEGGGVAVSAAWVVEDESGAPRTMAAGTAYDVYVSTNLAEGFVFDRRVTVPRLDDIPFDGPMGFWAVLVAE
jgi:pimeloyl-ACP methyl ester carboxylesterase